VHKNANANVALGAYQKPTLLSANMGIRTNGEFGHEILYSDGVKKNKKPQQRK
jgi:hypothetical protein